MILTLLVVAQLHGQPELQRTVDVDTVQQTYNPQIHNKPLKKAKNASCGLTPCINVRAVENMVNIHELYKSGAIK